MKLKINNFAKIRNAEIIIDGITVIVGENNSGKSTIGKVLYSIFTTFHNFDIKLRRERERGIAKSLFNLYINQLGIEKIGNLLEICKRIVDLKKFDHEKIKEILEEAGIVEVDESIMARIYNQLEFEDNELESLIVNNIFQEEFNGQITPMFDEGLISEVEVVIHDSTISIKFEKNKSVIISKIDLLNDGIYIDNPLIIDKLTKDNSTKDNSSMGILSSILGKDDIYTHETVLKNKLSKSLKSNESLIDEAIYRKRIEKIVEAIIETVSGDFMEHEDRFTFSERNYNAEIELANLSTGIKSFAILLKLLENRDINNNSIVVLDEPEVHLHPKWQLIYAELLVLLQKEFNLNIILTTHSPYFVTALEVYSRKYGIQKSCKYYLARLERDKAVFDDVTDIPEKIYKKLAEPFEILSREEDDMNDIEL